MKNILLAFFALCPALLFSQDQKGEVIDQIVAVVGGEVVLHSDIQNQILQYKSQGIDIKKEDECEIMEDLLFQKLLLHHAKLDSVEVGEAEIQSQIERRLEYFINLVGGQDKFIEIYGSIPEWKAEFHDDVRDQLMIQKMQYTIDQDVRITPGEVQEYYKSIPADSLPLIDAEVEFSQIIVSPQVTAEEKERTRLQLDSIRNEVITGQLSMSIAAFRYSDDPGSKYKGGCYDDVRRGNFVPEYEAAVFQTEEGGFSEIFESDFGFHFVQVKEKRGEFFSSCHVLKKPQIYEDEVVKSKILLDSLSIEIQNDSLSFVDAALRYSTDEETKNQKGRVANYRTGGMKHGVNDLSPEMFFILEKLELNQISEPVLLSTPDGSSYYAILKLDNRIEAHIANLKYDYTLFQGEAEAQLKQEELLSWVEMKLKNTYVKLYEDSKNCKFRFDWWKDNL